MSEHPHVTTINRMTKAVFEQDREALAELFSEDMVFHVRGSLPCAGEHRGVTGFLAALGTLFDLTNGDVRLEQLLCVADGLWAVEWEKAMYGRQGGILETEDAFVYRFEDGRIAEIWMLDASPPEASAFWESRPEQDDPTRDGGGTNVSETMDTTAGTTTAGTTTTVTAADGPSGAEAARDALAERLLGATVGALDLVHVWLGEHLGLYRALADGGSLTAAGLAARAGIDERYAREWLEHQAVAGILAAGDQADPAKRTFSLPPGHDEVLLDGDSLSYTLPMALGVVGVAQVLPACGRPSVRARACPTTPTDPTPATSSPAATVPCSSTCWPASGSRPSPPWPSGWPPTRRPGWPTWGAGPAGRRSPSPGASPRRSSPASTSTGRRSRRPAPARSRPAWPTG